MVAQCRKERSHVEGEGGALTPFDCSYRLTSLHVPKVISTFRGSRPTFAPAWFLGHPILTDVISLHVRQSSGRSYWKHFERSRRRRSLKVRGYLSVRPADLMKPATDPKLVRRGFW
jgi:hypothetical protein